MSSAVVHCRRGRYDIYVGRGNDPRSGELGEWGNPYSHRPSRVPDVIVVGSVEEAVARHRRWLWDELRSGRLALERMATWTIPSLTETGLCGFGVLQVDATR